MSCYHPLKAFQIGIRPNGKLNLKIVSYGVDHLERDSGDDKWIPVTYPVSDYSAGKVMCTEFMEIPCGKCIGCRIKYSKDWAARCMLEAQYHDSNYFVTLTYDDAHVPLSAYGDPDTGEALDCMTLKKRDLQLFFKRLRYFYPDDHIRYYCCGEYGDSTARPHYHCIIFGLHLDDLVVLKKSRLGDMYYTSEKLASVWQQGNILVASVTWETCAYTARYVLKKSGNELADVYSRFNVAPEFVLMSRRPGIASQYFEDHKDLIYDCDKIYLSLKTGGRSLHPPKFFDKKYDLDDHVHMEAIKGQRRLASTLSRESKLAQTDLDYLQHLQVEERSFNRKLGALKRPEI